MKSVGSIGSYVASFKSAGYEAEGYYMFVPRQEAAARAFNRFWRDGKANGRYVPVSIILGNVNNEANFETLKPAFRKWAIYENMGKKPKLYGSGKK